MASDEDDKPTMVIDLNALKRERERKEKELASIGEDLEFASKPDISLPGHTVVFFDHGNPLPFSPLAPALPAGHDYHFTAALPELNGWIKKKTPLVVVFYYDGAPQAINQLCAQVRLKFPWVQVVLAAKNLGAQKTAAHQASPAGAAAYVAYPLVAEELARALHELEKKAA
jgi:hypothetical protein